MNLIWLILVYCAISSLGFLDGQGFFDTIPLKWMKRDDEGLPFLKSCAMSFLPFADRCLRLWRFKFPRFYRIRKRSQVMTSASTRCLGRRGNKA